MTIRTSGVVVATLLATWTVAVSPAGAVVQSKCVSGKNKCVTKQAGALLKCEQKAATPSDKPIEPELSSCRQKATDKYNGGLDPEKGCFEKLESKDGNDCITFDDTAAAQLAVDLCVADIVQAIDPGAIDKSKCGAAKEKCATTKLTGLLKCYEKQQKSSKPVDQAALDACIAKVKEKFDGGDEPEKGCFAKLEAKQPNDCLPPTMNSGAVEVVVDACATDLLALLETSSTTTTAPPTTTTTAPPTTTTTAPPTTTTTTPTSTTTTTTIASSVTCGPNGLDVTVSLNYEPRITGGVYAMFLELDYLPPVSIPGSGTAASVRDRVTRLLPAGVFSFIPSDLDSQPPVGDDQIRTLVSATVSAPDGIPPGGIERVRFDCAAGTVVQPANFTCRPEDLADFEGRPFPPDVAALVGCSLVLSVP